MNIVILGASGLIGHKLYQKLKPQFTNVYGVMRRSQKELQEFTIFDDTDLVYDIDVLDFEQLKGIFTVLRPDVILNCVGITKRKLEINDPILALSTNALFPHQLAKWAKEHGVRVIHFSTDCVFDGSLGNYNENSLTTGKDAYGRTKAFGEIRYDHTLTIRSSFIGRELLGKTELLEWFLNQKSPQIKGFTNALYSGVSTIYMSKVVGDIIESYPNLSGLYQLALPKPISKYDLLCLAKEAFNEQVEIIPDSDFSIKPTLDGNKLATAMNLQIPTWAEMMSELAQEKNIY